MRALHWIKQALMMFVGLLVACPIYTLIMTVQGDTFLLEDILSLTGSFMLMFGMFFTMMFSTMLYTQDLPITISFGSTRKEAFWGIQLSRLTYTLLNLLCVAGLLLATNMSGTDPIAIPYVLAGYVVFHGLSGVMSILYVKFQKKGLITFGILLMVCVIGFTAGFVIATSNGTLPRFPSYTPWLLLGGGALFYCLVSLWEYRIIRNYNVKM